MAPRFAALALCLLALAACSPIPVSVEDLLDAPRLSEEQYQLEKALREQQEQEIKLKYPQSGSYRSAFTFHDIDGDGVDEAIVLHSYQSGGNAQITVMDRQGDQWLVEKTHPGLSPDVDFIRFEELLGPGQTTIVIGWRPEGSERIVAAYRYHDREFTLLGSEDYAQLAIGDYNGDGKSELLIVTAENAAYYSLLYMGEKNGLLDVLDSVSLGRRITGFQPPVSGEVAPGVFGIALDAWNDREELCTMAAYLAEEKLVLPLNAGDGALLTQTLRPGGRGCVYAQDVNGDGVIDIPTQAPFPGSEAIEEDNRLCVTTYMNLDAGGFTPVLRAFVDTEAGYRLTLPEEWFAGEESVTATRRAGSGEITFFLYGGGDITDRSRELLRIQVVDLQAPPRQFSPDSYFLMGRRGSFEYYAALPSGKGEEGYSLTQEQVLRLFQLL